jgi:hypothetical protein
VFFPGNSSVQGNRPLSVRAKDSGAYFASNRDLGDFTIEFDLFPTKLESGETVFSWTATRDSLLASGGTTEVAQEIMCISAKNRLKWVFSGFFTSPDKLKNLQMTLEGRTPLTPETWSHHMIRYQKSTGLLEYLVDGRLEAAAHTTLSQKETPGEDVFIPVTGNWSEFELCGSYTGILDEFKIYSSYVERDSGLYQWKPSRYPKSGGRVKSAVLDLGGIGAEILRLDVWCGRTSYQGGRMFNEYLPIRAGAVSSASNVVFDNFEEAAFFIRSGDSKYDRDGLPWQPIGINQELNGVKGRYIEIAADLYTGAQANTTPYIAQINVVYQPSPPPAPPARVLAAPSDGAVTLSWRASAGAPGAGNEPAKGYLLYYGTESGVYLGDDGNSAAPRSPIDVGNSLSYHLDKLVNGRLYYFSVAAYGNSIAEAGNFSREITARPVKQTIKTTGITN